MGENKKRAKRVVVAGVMAAKLAREVIEVVGDDRGAAEIVRATLRLITNRRRMI